MNTNQILTRKPLLYLLLTFTISWTAWGILAAFSHNSVLQYGQPVFMILYLAGGLGPFIAAFIVNKKYASKQEYKKFIKEIVRVKVDFSWYLWVIFIPLVVSSIPWFIACFSAGHLEPLFKGPFYMALVMLPMMVIGGGLEEVGWRGVLFPGLLKTNTVTVASLITAIMWTIWHLPLWFINGLPQTQFNFGVFFVSVLGITFLLSVLYTFTESIFLCILLHSFFNSYGNNLNGTGLNPYWEAIIKLTVCIVFFAVYQLARVKISPANSYVK